MSNTEQCPTCKGCGKVDNKEGKAWAELTATPNPLVRSGELSPIDCRDCNGLGVKPSAPAAPKEATPEAQPPPAVNSTEQAPAAPPSHDNNLEGSH